MSLINAYMSLNDRYGSENWVVSRLLPFLGLGFFALIPIGHAAIIFPYEQFQKQAGLNYYYLEGVLMVAGVIFLAVRANLVSGIPRTRLTCPTQTKFPERWLPGTFDYWGASHQIFHCFVVLGTVSHFAGVMSAFEWNHTHQRCAAPLMSGM